MCVSFAFTQVYDYYCNLFYLLSHWLIVFLLYMNKYTNLHLYDDKIVVYICLIMVFLSRTCSVLTITKAEIKKEIVISQVSFHWFK